MKIIGSPKKNYWQKKIDSISNIYQNRDDQRSFINSIMKGWLVWFIWIPFTLFAQAHPVQAYEEDLVLLAPALLDAEQTDDQRKASARQFLLLMEKALNQPNSFDFNFSKLKNLAIVGPADKRFRIFTWFSVENYRKKAYGLIQMAPQKGSNQKTVFRLLEQEEGVRNVDFKTFGPEKWPGAMYYDLMPVHAGGQKAYVLLGFHPSDNVVHRKTIDILTFTKNGEPRFGLPVFMVNQRKAHRIQFQYNAMATMSLRFDKLRRRIIFDHLSPPDISMKNQFQHYGPDFSVDAYDLKGGHFVFVEDLDVMNRDENLGGPGERLSVPSRPSLIRKDAGKTVRPSTPDSLKAPEKR